MARKRKPRFKPLPPGSYSMKVGKVRKVRNKDAIRITYVFADGTETQFVVSSTGRNK